MSEIKKRDRLPNFSNLEKIKLIQLIEKYKNMIENKKTDNINLKEKEKCWINISKEYNSSCSSVHRDVASLKSCWDNLKKKHENIMLKFEKKFSKQVRSIIYSIILFLKLYYHINLIICI